MRRRFNPAEQRKTPGPFTLAGLRINFDKHLVVIRSEEVHLTRIELLLLSELAHNASRLMTYGELLTRLWGLEYRDDVQILRTWISRLRYKIEEDPKDPKIIRTMPKIGYMIDVLSA